MYEPKRAEEKFSSQQYQAGFLNEDSLFLKNTSGDNKVHNNFANPTPYPLSKLHSLFLPLTRLI